MCENGFAQELRAIHRWDGKNMRADGMCENAAERATTSQILRQRGGSCGSGGGRAAAHFSIPPPGHKIKNPRFQLANIFFFFKLWLLDFQQFKYWISHVCIFSTAMRLFSVCVASLWKAKVGAHEPWTRQRSHLPPPSGHQLPGRTLSRVSSLVKTNSLCLWTLECKEYFNGFYLSKIAQLDIWGFSLSSI